MLLKYANAIHPYLPEFDKMGYEIKVELGRLNMLEKVWATNLLPIKNGYECHVYCVAEKNGEEVRIKSDDGEADYYPVITSWMISSVFKKRFKLKVALYEDVDDVTADMNTIISQLLSIEVK